MKLLDREVCIGNHVRFCPIADKRTCNWNVRTPCKISQAAPLFAGIYAGQVVKPPSTNNV
jgi:hypothetical protein